MINSISAIISAINMYNDGLMKEESHIIDELKMCSSEEIATVKKIVDAFVLKKTEPY